MHKIFIILTLIISSLRTETSLDCLEEKLQATEAKIRLHQFRNRRTKETKTKTATTVTKITTDENSESEDDVEDDTENAQKDAKLEVELTYTKIIEAQIMLLKTQTSDSDEYWRETICGNALQSFKDLSKTIINFFCSSVSTKKILGDLQDLKYGFFVEYMDKFTDAFKPIYKKIQEKQNIKLVVEQTQDIDALYNQVLTNHASDIGDMSKMFQDNILEFVKGEVALCDKSERNAFQQEDAKFRHDSYSFWIFLVKTFGSFKGKDQIKGVITALEKFELGSDESDKADFFMHYFNYLIVESQKGKNTDEKIQAANDDKKLFLNYRQKFTLVCLQTFQNISQELSDKFELQKEKCNKLSDLIFVKMNAIIEELNTEESLNKTKKKGKRSKDIFQMSLGHLVWGLQFFETIEINIENIITEHFDSRLNNFFTMDSNLFVQQIGSKFDDGIKGEALLKVLLQNKYDSIKFIDQSFTVTDDEKFMLWRYDHFYVNSTSMKDSVEFVRDLIKEKFDIDYEYYQSLNQSFDRRQNKNSSKQMEKEKLLKDQQDEKYRNEQITSILNRAQGNQEMNQYISNYIKRTILDNGKKVISTNKKTGVEETTYDPVVSKQLRRMFYYKFEYILYSRFAQRFPQKKEIIKRAVFTSFKPEFIQVQDEELIYDIILDNSQQIFTELKTDGKSAVNIAKILSSKIKEKTYNIIQIVESVIMDLENRQKEMNIPDETKKMYILRYISQYFKLSQQKNNEAEVLTQFYIPSNFREAIREQVDELMHKSGGIQFERKVEQNKKKTDVRDQIQIKKQIYFENIETEIDDLFLNILDLSKKTKTNLVRGLLRHLRNCEKVDEQSLPEEDCKKYFDQKISEEIRTQKDFEYPCESIHPGLTVEKCESGKIREGRFCIPICPEGFTQNVNNPMECNKPQVETVNEAGNCQRYFRKSSDLCFPVCPIAFEDLSQTCLRPKSRKYAVFKHRGFYNRSAPVAETA